MSLPRPSLLHLRLQPLATLAFLLLLSMAQPVLGCDCFENPKFSAPRWVRNSAAVFLGRVTRIEADRLVVQFAVSEAWKGVVTPRVEVTGASSDCDFPFETGREYLVFADASGGRLVAGLCSGTAEKQEAWTKLRKLRQWRRPRLFQ